MKKWKKERIIKKGGLKKKRKEKESFSFDFANFAIELWEHFIGDYISKLGQHLALLCWNGSGNTCQNRDPVLAHFDKGSGRRNQMD